MWTLQSALLSSLCFRLVLKRLFRADQNSHSLIWKCTRTVKGRLPCLACSKSAETISNPDLYMTVDVKMQSSDQQAPEGRHPHLPLLSPSLHLHPHTLFLSLHRPGVVAKTRTHRVHQPWKAARCLGCCTSAETQIRPILICCGDPLLVCFLSFSKKRFLKRVLISW